MGKKKRAAGRSPAAKDDRPIDVGAWPITEIKTSDFSLGVKAGGNLQARIDSLGIRIEQARVAWQVAKLEDDERELLVSHIRLCERRERLRELRELQRDGRT